MSKILIALRHGQRADRHFTNRPNPLRYDPCLTEKGLIQAQQSAERIKSLVPQGSNVHVVSSPFLRTIETASFVSKAFGVPVHVDKGFGEILLSCDFNSNPVNTLKFFNKKNEVQEDVGCLLVENKHLTEARFPESVEAGYRRVSQNWDSYFRNVKADVYIVVTHLYVVGALSQVWLGRDFAVYDEEYCKMTLARHDGRQYSVEILCDHSHATQ